MASNKESVVLIIDVGIGVEEFTEKAVDRCIELIKNKMFYYPKDMVSILLLRTLGTKNPLHDENPDRDKYKNITQVLPASQMASWSMIKHLKNALTMPRSYDGNWIDALNVAVAIVKEDTALHKIRFAKIALFTNFNVPLPEEENLGHFADLQDVMFFLVHENISFDRDNCVFPDLKDHIDKTEREWNNEVLAMDLYNNTYNTRLVTFADAVRVIARKPLKRPWSWNATLTIGSTITIHIFGVIRIKESADVPKFKKTIQTEFGQSSRRKRFYCGVEELSESNDDLITGYMLGASPIQFDPTLGANLKDDTKRGIHFIGFVAEDQIPEEHFSGPSTYEIYAQRDKEASADLLEALVSVMLKDRLNILAWKVFNNGQKAKLVVLIPNTRGIPSMSMIELSYHNQHRFWEFPKLDTKKNQPTCEQLAAIDQLMGAMDLSEPPEERLELIRTGNNPLQYDFLPNIRAQLLLDYMDNVILKQSREIPPKRPIKEPDVFQPQAFVAVEKIKAMFPLQKTETTTKEKLKEHFKAPDMSDELTPSTSSSGIEEDIRISQVGTVTPADDFDYLVSHVINRMPYGPERSAKFHHYACQMRTVITDLLFKSMTKQYKKIEKALVTYRKLIMAANSAEDYNDWIKDIRRKLVERKMFDFWEEVIVKQKLGPWIQDNPESEVDFYDISKEIAATTEPAMEDDDDVEDLFDNM